MDMNGPVLVGTDFSSSSKRATDLAAALAARLGRPLAVAQVWNTNALANAPFSGEIELAPVMAAAREGARKALDEEVERVRTSGGEARPHLVEGVASRALAELGRALDAELVVLGRRGSAGLAHVLLGSVSERVARIADRPVLVVPDGAEAAPVPRRLLVGVDFSGAAREAVAAALRFTAAFGCAPPVLVHAYQDERAEWLASWSETGRVGLPRPDGDDVARWVERALPEASDLELVSVAGAVEEQLVATARDHEADWIAVGLQGRTALATFLMGTTTRSVLELADRPVLVVPGRTAPDREAID